MKLCKSKMSAMRNFYKDVPAAILGGGPSLPADITRLPHTCVMIAVNYHAFHHAEHVDFMVYNDEPKTNPLMEIAVKEHRAVHVSPEPTSDILFDVDVWTGFFSSNTAVWFADWMGCAPVILCGMDCYQGALKHCPPSEYYSPMFDMPLDFYTRPWREDCKSSITHPEHVRAMSGPLVEIFGAYEETL